jgi:hypothetical protein
MKRRLRCNRVAGPGRSPARPREAKRQSDLIPVRGDCFHWRPGELILGPEAKRDLTAILRDRWTVVGPAGRRK